MDALEESVIQKIGTDASENISVDEYEEPAIGESAVLDEVLFSMLKSLRKSIAEKKGVPPYVIFQDPSLEDMATTYPISLDELKNIRGVGDGKAARYGKEFCELIAKYCEEN